MRRPVLTISQRTHHTPLALGAVGAYARAYRSGVLQKHYDFDTTLHSNTNALLRRLREHETPVLLFSHYLWSSSELLAISAKVKAEIPGCITVHGGPNVPSYERASADYLARGSHIDVTVRGEGEGTLAELLEALAEEPSRDAWPTTLGSVHGLTFRTTAGSLMRTAERTRMTDLASLPSPYLEGWFNGGHRWMAAIIETNRGCPYGCTFCDWGSATLQKIKCFPLERIKEEIEWTARNSVDLVWVADANFGVFERDVEIVEHVVRTKERFGFPRRFTCTFAKNSSERVAEIARLLIGAHLLDSGRLSLQSTDPETLSVIRRANIKTKKYVELRKVYEDNKVPISTELIFGLPGQTLSAFKNDLQFCFDQRTFVFSGRCILLPNSPMADPAYVRAHDIRCDDRSLVLSTRAATEADVQRMQALSRFYLAFVDYGVLKYLLRFLQNEHGIRSIDFLDRLLDDCNRGDATLHRTRRMLNLLARENVYRVAHRPLVVLSDWVAFYDEIARYLEATYKVPRDASLTSVLTAQRCVMPSITSSYPKTVHLQHDVVAYFAALRAGDDGHAPKLASYGPGTMVISDPYNLRLLLLLSLGRLPLGIMRVFFELESPLMASSVRPHLLYSPDHWTVVEALRTARHLTDLVADRMLRLADSHTNLGRTLWRTVRALREPAVG